MTININSIAKKIQLTEVDKAVVTQAINAYCINDTRIKTLGNDLLSGLKNVTGFSDWLKGIEILEKNIPGEKSRETAIFLLEYCLSFQAFCQGIAISPPISLKEWNEKNYVNLTLDKVLTVEKEKSCIKC